MLDRTHRLTQPRQFEAAIRAGRRSGGSLLVVHLGREPDGRGPARAGLVVGKAVGNAVQRNRVKRRLRHLLRERLVPLPDGAALVVRALPSAAAASSLDLGSALDKALSRLQATGVRR
jgi:ribonuclease P protein component